MTWWETRQWQAYEDACGLTLRRTQELEGASWDSQVVDLAYDESELWRGMRRSYHAIIHKAEGDFGLAWDLVSGGHTSACALICMPLHDLKVGRSTRPLETWEMMDQWVRDGHGQVAYVTRHTTGMPLGYVYAIVHGNWAYYASGVTLEPNLAHALIWHVMLALKKRGVRWFEVGWLWRPGEDEKAKSIAFFKQGFGGAAVPAADAARLHA